MPEVSIIILTKNQEKIIGEALQAVFNQDINCDFEVVVIDSGSRDNTLEIVKKYPVNLVQISPKEFGHGKTRNLGAHFAKGRYLVYLNSDAVPKNRYWLSNLLTNFSLCDKVAGVYSRIYPRLDCNPLDARDTLEDTYLFDNRLKNIHSFSEYNQMKPEEKRKFISFHTISCAINRDLLLKNFFDEVPFGEDLVWAKRMLEKGFMIIFEPKSEVIHSHNIHFSFIKTIKRYFDEARLNQSLLKRWTPIDLLKWLAVIAFASKRDLVYILRLNKSLIYKLRWIVYSPFVRIAEFIGILLGILPCLPLKLVNKLSLVEQIKQE